MTSTSANSTADRAIEVLLLFTEARPLWHAADIAERFGMPRSTTYRYLNTLKSYALVVEDERGGYRLGPRLFPLARTARRTTGIARIAPPHLEELQAPFGETVILFERVGHAIFPIERLESRHPVTVKVSPSQIAPWPANPSAKLMLAFAPPSEQEVLFAQLTPVRYTTKTISSFSALRKALASIRAQGYATGDEERDEGVGGVAAPIVTQGVVRYGIGVAAPSFRLQGQRLVELTAAVRRAAARVSEALAVTDF
ncbi:MAG: IclR family transcriptional regulator [Lautropia sp.]